MICFIHEFVLAIFWGPKAGGPRAEGRVPRVEKHKHLIKVEINDSSTKTQLEIPSFAKASNFVYNQTTWQNHQTLKLWCFPARFVKCLQQVLYRTTPTQYFYMKLWWSSISIFAVGYKENIYFFQIKKFNKSLIKFQKVFFPFVITRSVG